MGGHAEMGQGVMMGWKTCRRDGQRSLRLHALNLPVRACACRGSIDVAMAA